MTRDGGWEDVVVDEELDEIIKRPPPPKIFYRPRWTGIAVLVCYFGLMLLVGQVSVLGAEIMIAAFFVLMFVIMILRWAKAKDGMDGWMAWGSDWWPVHGSSPTVDNERGPSEDFFDGADLDGGTFEGGSDFGGDGGGGGGD